MHWHSRKEVDEREEAQHVSYDEYSLELDKFVAVEVELFGHSRNIGIVYSESVLFSLTETRVAH